MVTGVQIHSWGKDFYDDVSGKWLGKDLDIKARRLEIEFFRKLDVYINVCRSQAGGAKVITTRWLDTDKGNWLLFPAAYKPKVERRAQNG